MAGEGKQFRFDDVIVDRENFRVTKDGEEVTLTPRAFDVLTVLLQNAGRAVEKQEIFDAVWKDTYVTDNALVKVVKEIRQALGDGADRPHLIETVPKRGYRFIGQLEPDNHEGLPPVASAETSLPPDTPAAGYDRLPVESPVSMPAPVETRSPSYFWPIAAAALVGVLALGSWYWYRQSNAAQGQIRSIAVLPFKPLSAESRDESLEMGMAETLITNLSRLHELAVRPITSVRKYTDPSQDPIRAGQELQAEAVLEGNIQKAGDRIRITVRLLDVASGKPLWTDTFDENFTDIFKVQDSIAERVTSALSIRLSSDDRDRMARHYTDDPATYQQYLQCQLLWHGRRQNWVQKSLQCYEDIINKDPNFALAHVGAAEAYVMSSGQHLMPHKDAVANAKQHMAKALELDDSLAQAHTALAEITYQYDYNWQSAERSFRRAMELNPNLAWVHQAYGWFVMCQGRFEEAAVAMDKAKELDPSSVTIEVGRGRLYYFSRDYEKARLHFEKLIALEPNDTSLRFSLFTILERQQKYTEAGEQMLTLFRGPDPSVTATLRNVLINEGWEAFWRKQYEMVRERERQGGRAPTLFHATYHVRMGSKDEAFYWLGKRIDEADPGVLQYKIDPMYDSLRDDPRYAQLLSRIGLTP